MAQKSWGEAKLRNNVRCSRHDTITIFSQGLKYYLITTILMTTGNLKNKKNMRPNKEILKGNERTIKILGFIITIFIILAVTTGYYYFYIFTPGNNNSGTLITDTDSDGLQDSWELKNGLDPYKTDTDDDGLPDGWEVKYALEPLINDSSNDKDLDGFDKNKNGKLEKDEFFTNLDEYKYGTDPRSMDSDNDGMHDGWEVYFREKYELVENNYWLSEKPSKLDPMDPDDAKDDIDYIIKKVEGKIVGYLFAPDKLMNLQEFNKGTEPTNPDTDSDELSDYDEVERYGTSPINVDSDNDKLWDGWEIKYGGLLIGLDPNNFDTDEDGINDTFEDLDNDNLWNLDEFKYMTSPLKNDTDGDNLPDNWEEKYWTHQNHDQPNPTIYDSELDADNDGLINLLEFKYGTHPMVADTDGDGLTDGDEVIKGYNGELKNGKYIVTKDSPKYFTDPLKTDSDGDGINDAEEVNHGTDNIITNATNMDTDGDGINDSEEVGYGEDGFITNASSADTDNDFLTDFEEVFGVWGYYTKPTKSDWDDDGLLDGLEVLTDFYPFTEEINGTNPLIKDTDGDGMDDGWEAEFGYADRYNFTETIKKYDYKYGLIRNGYNLYDKLMSDTNISGVWLVNPLDPMDKFDDVDEDGFNESIQFPNIQEFEWKTNPLLWNSDGDIMHDGWEVYYWGYSTTLGIFGPDPTKADGDLDLDDDGIIYYINNKPYPDSFTNAEEYLADMNPNNWDENNNGKPDYYDIWFGDNDGDGLLNGFEILFNGKVTDPRGYRPAEPLPWAFDPDNNDSDGDGITDDKEDYDNDSYDNWYEQYIYGDINPDPGIIKNGPGCADPTRSSITPYTVLKSVVPSTRGEFVSNISRINADLNTPNNRQLGFDLDLWLDDPINNSGQSRLCYEQFHSFYFLSILFLTIFWLKKLRFYLGY